jgi:hypothetical protein
LNGLFKNGASFPKKQLRLNFCRKLLANMDKVQNCCMHININCKLHLLKTES